jgi:hypothetical protein
MFPLRPVVDKAVRAQIPTGGRKLENFIAKSTTSHSDLLRLFLLFLGCPLADSVGLATKFIAVPRDNMFILCAHYNSSPPVVAHIAHISATLLSLLGHCLNNVFATLLLLGCPGNFYRRLLLGLTRFELSFKLCNFILYI